MHFLGAQTNQDQQTLFFLSKYRGKKLILCNCKFVSLNEEKGGNVFKTHFFSCFWPFRTESGLRLCQLHRPKGCRESHQHVKWTQTSDQNHQGNQHAATRYIAKFQLARWQARTSDGDAPTKTADIYKPNNL